jgi:hypothetical protein
MVQCSNGRNIILQETEVEKQEHNTMQLQTTTDESARTAVLTVTVNVTPAVKQNSTELCSVEAKKVKRPHLTGTQTVRHAQQRQEHYTQEQKCFSNRNIIMCKSNDKRM